MIVKINKLYSSNLNLCSASYFCSQSQYIANQTDGHLQRSGTNSRGGTKKTELRHRSFARIDFAARVGIAPGIEKISSSMDSTPQNLDTLGTEFDCEFQAKRQDKINLKS